MKLEQRLAKLENQPVCDDGEILSKKLDRHIQDAAAKLGILVDAVTLEVLADGDERLIQFAQKVRERLGTVAGMGSSP